MATYSDMEDIYVAEQKKRAKKKAAPKKAAPKKPTGVKAKPVSKSWQQ